MLSVSTSVRSASIISGSLIVTGTPAVSYTPEAA
jgi:hypothetical protein